MVYLCSPHQIVFALDAATGELKWKFDPHLKDNPTFQHLTCRGVSYHETKPQAVTASGAPAPADCPRRIFLGTNDAQMFALNADTGVPCESFGNHGKIDLDAGMPYTTPGFYEITSPPVATDKILIVGGSVIDNYSDKDPSGVIRGFDIYTGALVWAWDAGNPDPNQVRHGRTDLHARFAQFLGRLRRRRATRAWSMCRSARAPTTTGAATAPRRRNATTAPWSRSISPPASCAGRIRTCITTSGTWTSRPSPAWSMCRPHKASCRQSIFLPRPAISSC